MRFFLEVWKLGSLKQFESWEVGNNVKIGSWVGFDDEIGRVVGPARYLEPKIPRHLPLPGSCGVFTRSLHLERTTLGSMVQRG